MDPYQSYLKAKYSTDGPQNILIEKESKLGGISRVWAYVMGDEKKLLPWNDIVDAIIDSATNPTCMFQNLEKKLSEYVLYIDRRWNTYAVYAHILARRYGDEKLMTYLERYYPLTEFRTDLQECVSLHGIFTGTSAMGIISYCKFVPSKYVILNILTSPFELSDCAYKLQQEFVEHVKNSYNITFSECDGFHRSHSRTVMLITNKVSVNSFLMTPIENNKCCTCMSSVKSFRYAKFICMCGASNHVYVERTNDMYQENLIKTNEISDADMEYLKNQIENFSTYIKELNLENRFNIFCERVFCLTDKKKQRINIWKKIYEKENLKKYILDIYPTENTWILRHINMANILEEMNVYFPYALEEDGCLGAFASTNDYIFNKKRVPTLTSNIIHHTIVYVDVYGYATHAKIVEHTPTNTNENTLEWIQKFLKDELNSDFFQIHEHNLLWIKQKEFTLGYYTIIKGYCKIYGVVAEHWSDFSSFTRNNPITNRLLRYGIVHTYTRCMYTCDESIVIYTPKRIFHIPPTKKCQIMNITKEESNYIHCESMNECAYILKDENDTKRYQYGLDILAKIM
jgi:hypothetical protein